MQKERHSGRFYGAAARYLDNYLGWHRMFDKNPGVLTGRAFLAASFRQEQLSSGNPCSRGCRQTSAC